MSVNEVIIFKNDDGSINLSVTVENETVWLTQKQLIELYQTAKSTVSEHIKNIYNDEELTPEATVRKIRTVQKEGNRKVSRELEYYNLDRFTKIYGKGTLENAGTVSHDKAMKKAEEEYIKYQAKTLTPVEKDYLDTIKSLEEKVEKNGGKS